MPVATGHLQAHMTQIPDLLLDNIDVFSDCEFRVMMCVARATFGWHEKTDSLNRAEIARRIGRTRQSVTLAVCSLVEHRLLVVQSADGELLDTPESRRRIGKAHRRLFYSLNTAEQVDIRSGVPPSAPIVKISSKAENLTIEGVLPMTDSRAHPRKTYARAPKHARVEISVLAREVDSLIGRSQPNSQESCQVLRELSPNVDCWMWIDRWLTPDDVAFPESHVSSILRDLRDNGIEMPLVDRTTALTDLLLENLDNREIVWALRGLREAGTFSQVAQLATRFSLPFVAWALLDIRHVPVEDDKVILFPLVMARHKAWCRMVNDKRAEIEASLPPAITEEDLREVGFSG